MKTMPGFVQEWYTSDELRPAWGNFLRNYPERGLLANYPPDVIRVVNGVPVTKADVLQAKRERQAREWAWKRRATSETVVPCFVWAFDNGPIIPYGGWHLYVRTAKRDYSLRGKTENSLQAMRVFPCGFLPMIENATQWLPVFAEAYHYPTKKRPKWNGLALAKAKISPSGQLRDIMPWANLGANFTH